VLTAALLLEAGVRLVGWGLHVQQQSRISEALREEGAYRILCVGDSMTARQYPPFLEAALGERLPDKPVVVLDAGRHRMTAPAVVAALPAHLDRYEPDMVIAMMGFNDEDQPLEYGDIPPTADTPLKSYDLLRLLLYNHRTRVRGGGAGGQELGRGHEAPPDCDAHGLAERDRAICLAQQNPTGEGIALLEQIVQRDPQDVRARDELARLYWHLDRGEEARRLRATTWDPRVRDAYRELRRVVHQRGILLVCMQYPMRDVEPLERMLAPAQGEQYVDSAALFLDAVRDGRFEDYFLDMFGGDFGHPTAAGNELLAGHLADTLVERVFDPHRD